MDSSRRAGPITTGRAKARASRGGCRRSTPRSRRVWSRLGALKRPPRLQNERDRAPPEGRRRRMAQYFSVHPENPQPRLDPPGRGHHPRGRRDRLPDGLLLRARLPHRRQGGDGADPPHPRRGRAPPVHAGLPRPLRGRAVRQGGQPAIPTDPRQHAGPATRSSCVRRATCRGGCCIRATPSACASRPSRGAGAAGSAGRAAALLDADPPGARHGAQRCRRDPPPPGARASTS